MNNGAKEFGVSIFSFWVAIILMMIIPEQFNLIIILGFVVAVVCGLLAGKIKDLL
jgi:hypothetical protein